MVQNYTFTDEEIGFQINSGTLNVRVQDIKRSSSGNVVNVIVKFEIGEDSNGNLALQYQEMDYPGQSIKPRDFVLLQGITSHIESLGFTVQGVPSTS